MFVLLVKSIKINEGFPIISTILKYLKINPDKSIWLISEYCIVIFVICVSLFIETQVPAFIVTSSIDSTL